MIVCPHLVAAFQTFFYCKSRLTYVCTHKDSCKHYVTLDRQQIQVSHAKTWRLVSQVFLVPRFLPYLLMRSATWQTVRNARAQRRQHGLQHNRRYSVAGAHPLERAFNSYSLSK